MKIKTIPVGNLQANCYLLIKDNQCLIIDPGSESKKIMEIIGDLQPLAILLTHHHFDHVGALETIKNRYNIDVYDNDNLTEGFNKINNFAFEVIKTYGHTDDSITYYFKKEKMMFSGDFIFKGTVGRCDLPSGDFNIMLSSIAKIKKYDDDITIYPGHGDITSLKEERQTNPYFNYKSTLN
ncbi:MAG: MBL fold metallo-hydrolase [Bacilli bacterium]|nr:MBL fold metallo-hydrolase [Bacilli bacterium]